MKDVGWATPDPDGPGAPPDGPPGDVPLPYGAGADGLGTKVCTGTGMTVAVLTITTASLGIAPPAGEDEGAPAAWLGTVESPDDSPAGVGVAVSVCGDC